MRGKSGILIATLGAKPQVITTAADLLLRGGHSLQKVLVLHTEDEQGPMATALARLRDEFASHPAYQPLQFELQPIRGPDGTLADVATEADAHAAFRAIYRAVWEAKRAEYAVHLSIVGGRKVFAVYGMASAQLLFDDDDRLWYVLVGGRFWAEERLHPGPGDEAQLVPVPVLRWGTISPMLTDLSRIADPFEAAERQKQQQLNEMLERARLFVMGSLSFAERPVVEILARERLSDAEIGERLSLSPRTVEQHLRSAYRKAAAHWDLADVNRAQLVGLLSVYYTLRG